MGMVRIEEEMGWELAAQHLCRALTVGSYIGAKCLTQVAKAKYGWIPAAIGSLITAGLVARKVHHTEHEGSKELGKRVVAATVLGGASALVGSMPVAVVSGALLTTLLGDHLIRLDEIPPFLSESLLVLAFDYFIS